MRLAEYLAAPRPAWDWKAHDCCRWLDRWIQLRGHGSPMQALGIQYDSERSALRRITEAGGLVPLWTAGMALLLVPETDVFRSGDVGIITSATACGSDEVTAIYTGERWVSLGLRGLDFGPAIPLKAWRV